MPEHEEDPLITREEQIQVEMAMQRRADHTRAAAAGREPTSTSELIDTVLARVTVLPDDLARRWDSANLSLRNAKRDLARAPDDPVRQDSVLMMERQVLRVWSEVCAYKALTEIRQCQLSAA